MFSVIFDMDGTLFDTQRIFIPAWDFAGENQGYKNMGEHIPAVCGVNRYGCEKYLRDNFPKLDIERFRADTQKYIADKLVVRFKSGAKELIDYLKARGVKIGLATGTSRPSTEHHLKEVGIYGIFDAVTCGTEVENGKPAPDIFLETARKMGAKPEDCFVFEDSANGIRAGYKAGMKCIGIADVAPFSDDVKPLMLCELDSMHQAIEIFEGM